MLSLHHYVLSSYKGSNLESLLICRASKKEATEAQQLTSDHVESCSPVLTCRTKRKKLLAWAVFGFGTKITWGLLHAFFGFASICIHSAQVSPLLVLMQCMWMRSLSVIITFFDLFKSLWLWNSKDSNLSYKKKKLMCHHLHISWLISWLQQLWICTYSLFQCMCINIIQHVGSGHWGLDLMFQRIYCLQIRADRRESHRCRKLQLSMLMQAKGKLFCGSVLSKSGKSKENYRGLLIFPITSFNSVILFRQKLCRPLSACREVFEVAATWVAYDFAVRVIQYKIIHQG